MTGHRHILLASIILLANLSAAPQSATDSTSVPMDKRHGRSILKRIGRGVANFVKGFGDIDTSYIEPQAYNYTAMMQNTNTYEIYRIASTKGNTFTFAPLPSVKLGPYLGWRWVFLGYTFDLKHISNGNKKTELDLSLYSSQIGVDLFWRKTGNDYKISKLLLDPDGRVDTRPLQGAAYDGINVSIKGANLYYIFNHKRFSYPAAFSQSTVQRRSCGSALAGIGYTKHSLKIDWEKLYDMVATRLGDDIAQEYMDGDLKMKEIKYTDLSISGGYAYNWVFAPRWLLAASLSMALAYKSTSGNDNREFLSFKDFSLHNINVDGVGRFGIVWNNMRWYYGANVIVHTYNYHKKKFSTNNFFGSLNIYIGVNFGRNKQSK